MAHIIFSGNPAEREAWLGRGGIRREEFAHLRGHKPVVHGSDAHSIAKLFNPAKQRYCWIKADPTFDGLRQILYEPDDRIWIGDAPPNADEVRAIIDSITLTSTNDWFEEDKQIPLNSSKGGEQCGDDPYAGLCDGDFFVSFVRHNRRFHSALHRLRYFLQQWW